MELWKLYVQPEWPLLMAPDAASYKGPVVVSSMAEIWQRQIEPAGKAFEDRRIAAQGSAASKAAMARRAAAAAKTAGGAGAEDEDDTSDLSSEEKKRLTLLMGSDNHYEMLGLGQLNINASDDQIRKAYRRMVLRYHPDKITQAAAGTAAGGAAAGSSSSSSGSGDAATDPLFIAIQKAYDVLSDEKRRRAYDSQYEFDETIPGDSREDKEKDAVYYAARPLEFFRDYGPVFERNARWSSKKPVPKLGGPSAAEEDVKAFYQFWFAFESWRDFTALAEHKVENAEARDEKRWMERENAKIVTKHKKAEVQRLWELTTRAYARDPRVQAMKKAEEDEKKAAREAKLAAKKAAEDELKAAQEAVERKKREEEEAVKAEAQARKERKEREKKQLRRIRNDLRRLVAAARAQAAKAGGGAAAVAVTEEDVELLCSPPPSQPAAAGAGASGGAGAGAPSTPTSAAAAAASAPTLTGAGDLEALAAIWRTACSQVGIDVTASASGEAPAAAGVTASIAVEELPLEKLQAALACVVTAVAAAKAAQEEHQKAKQAAAAAAGPSTGATVIGGPKQTREWTVPETGMLAKGVAKFPPGTRNRWQAIADFVNSLGIPGAPRTAEECIAKAKTMGEEDRKQANTQAFSVYMSSKKEVEVKDTDAPVPEVKVSIVDPTAVAAAAKAGAAATGSKTGTLAPAGGVAAPATAPAAAAASAAAVADPSGWTADQQSALERALKTFPASMDKNERWKCIAEAVPGKTKKDCIARFKELREQVLQAKGGKPAAGEE